MRNLRPWLAVGAIIAVAMGACGGDDSDSQGPGPSTPARTATGTSIETTSAEPDGRVPPVGAGYEEAFPGLPEYERPVAMVEVPGQGIMLLVLQEGRVLAFSKDGPYEEPSTALDHRSRTNYSGEQGLLAIALDPGFETNGYAYLYYSARGGQRRTVISRMETTGAGANLALDPASELLILEVPQPYANHNGGQLLFGPDGMLYLGLGDGGNGGDPHGNGQDIEDNLLGSIIRIDVSGSTVDEPYAIPADNPLVNGGGQAETWAYGLRNPWRMSFDRETGTLWAGDVGETSFEEVNIIEAGNNYGWNIMEGRECFEPAETCEQDGLTLPVYAYGRDSGCSITGGYVYRGQAYPSLRGWYLFSDYCSGHVWAIDTTAAEAGEEVEPLQLWTGPGIVTFAEDASGELYAIAFEGGRVYRITAEE